MAACLLQGKEQFFWFDFPHFFFVSIRIKDSRTLQNFAFKAVKAGNPSLVSVEQWQSVLEKSNMVYMANV
jgi:hypothetical protein